MQTNSNETVFSDSKKHYEILDGLRGVAAVMVVVFHLFETFSGNDHVKQIINHGYLCVDFFFLLSGFVIGYAYDDRWGQMSMWDFFKRRLIRLHPMIIMGMIVGAMLFYYGDFVGTASVVFPNMPNIQVWKVVLTMLVGFTLIPLPLSVDIRGWQEMHPLDGPAWSLFFEYVGNILYALFVRKFSNTLLGILVFISGCALIHLAVTSPNGDVIGGWSLDPTQFKIGLTRLMFPFFGGLLLSRLCKPTSIKNSFLTSSLLLIAVISFPRVGGYDHKWFNGLYDSLSIILLFPLVVYIGASGEVKGEISSKICKFLGDISYPIYITHYPLIYIYTAWIVDKHIPMSDGWPMGVALLITSILLAYACLKFYDIPVRKWLVEKIV